MITRICFYTAADATNPVTTGWQHLVQTSEGTPTVLATVAPVSNNPQNGFNSKVELFFICDTDVKRHLTLKANTIVDKAVKGHCVVEYFA